jgi:hypothetical protein
MRDMADELELGRSPPSGARRDVREARDGLRTSKITRADSLAVERLRRDAPPELEKPSSSHESARLEMARSFASSDDCRRPRAEIDVGELRATPLARPCHRLAGRVDVADDVPMIHGHCDALARVEQRHAQRGRCLQAKQKQSRRPWMFA